MNLPSKALLDNLYCCYNRREYVHPDPLEFLYDYNNLSDREIVALIASSLAYGRVYKILDSVSHVLIKMKPSPLEYLHRSNYQSILKDFSGFKHRFTTDEELAHFLSGIGGAIKKYGSLHNCFQDCIRYNNSTNSIIAALTHFRNKILIDYNSDKNSLMPDPAKGSACKRLNLFLRWMIRNDEVDPGGWELISPSNLIYPIDTHMHKLGLALKLTARKQGDIKTALEITEAFKQISPEDPVKYDFCLTRLGIRDDTDMEAFIKECNNNL